MEPMVGEAIFTSSINTDIKNITDIFTIPEPVSCDAVIKDATGKVMFEKKQATVPKDWSQLALNIAAEKYLRKGVDAENSIYDMVDRVVWEIRRSGLTHGYFNNETDAEVYAGALRVLLLNQVFSFNSPVWFNVGVHKNPRISACFILGIEDTMESILECAQVEGMIYKYGSGSGINYSNLRGSGEALSHGGVSSGPLSFIQLGDAVAGSIKSGGTTRRAAKMVILNVDHPDVEEFIDCKAEEEEKAKVLIAAGYPSDFRDPKGAYATVGFQNANHSIRVTDGFMEAVELDQKWALIGRTGGYLNVLKSVPAKDLFRKMAKAAWRSGDPGIQFDTTANRWNTLAHEGKINGSNPCSEYMSLDNTACNLASINLIKFLTPDGFNYELFASVSRLVTIALDILIEDASYPTATIDKNVRRYRQIGLGFSNLGSLLMAQGIPYDSTIGRMQASAIASTMTASAYQASALMAGKVGPFPAYENSFVLSVLERHQAAVGVHGNGHTETMYNEWEKAYNLINTYGARNSYVTNIAPTGTIGLQMDCDTTGIEPELALVKTKKLVGGGSQKMVNQTVVRALIKLGHSGTEIESVLSYIQEHGTVKDCRLIAIKDEPIFATSFDTKNGIAWEAHVKMMAAVQPFVSGSISKTVNMPSNATVEDVEKAYMMAWKSGLKCLAIYRDGCKESQPLSTNEKKLVAPKIQERHKMPDDRNSITHKFNVAGHEGYLTVGLYPDGTPGELFVIISKEGSFVSGLLDSWATIFSLAIQYGMPLEKAIEKMKGHTYEPQGITSNPNYRFAKSITDYIAVYLEQTFLGVKAHAKATEEKPGNTPKRSIELPPCSSCGSLMTPSGSCYKCENCGSTSGCS